MNHDDTPGTGVTLAAATGVCLAIGSDNPIVVAAGALILLAVAIIVARTTHHADHGDHHA